MLTRGGVSRAHICCVSVGLWVWVFYGSVRLVCMLHVFKYPFARLPIYDGCLRPTVRPSAQCSTRFGPMLSRSMAC